MHASSRNIARWSSAACPARRMHKADEHVRIADLEALTALYGAFLRRYFGAAR